MGITDSLGLGGGVVCRTTRATFFIHFLAFFFTLVQSVILVNILLINE